MTRICVFDSGVGGLSIVSPLQSRVAHQLHYLMDNAFLPYGEKSSAQICQRLKRLVENYLRQYGSPDLFIIACNSASTAALAFLRHHFPALTFVGVVPAVKPAAATSEVKSIGILATPATCNGHYLDDLIQQHAAHCHVHKIPAPTLVHMIENHLLQGQPLALQALSEQFCQLRPAIDRLVLGCTHYPLVSNALAALLPESIRLIDSGDAIARRVGQLIKQSGQLSKAQKDVVEKEDLLLATAPVTKKAWQRLQHYHAFADWRPLYSAEAS